MAEPSDTPAVTAHRLELCQDFDGDAVAECCCGWTSPTGPDIETAANFFGQHIVDVTRKGPPS